MQAVSSRTARAAEAMRYAEIAAPVSLILSYIRKQANTYTNKAEREQELIQDLFDEMRARLARQNVIVYYR